MLNSSILTQVAAGWRREAAKRGLAKRVPTSRTCRAASCLSACQPLPSCRPPACPTARRQMRLPYAAGSGAHRQVRREQRGSHAAAGGEGAADVCDRWAAAEPGRANAGAGWGCTGRPGCHTAPEQGAGAGWGWVGRQSGLRWARPAALPPRTPAAPVSLCPPLFVQPSTFWRTATA